MSSMTVSGNQSGFSLAQYVTCLNGIVWRGGLRFLHPRERFVSALVWPLVWVFIFAAGFPPGAGLSLIPPYGNFILYGVVLFSHSTLPQLYSF